MGSLALDKSFDFEKWKVKKYGHLVDRKILKEYKREDDFITFHEHDKDLEQIDIYLPVSPDWDKIDGFGLPARKQKFRVPKEPQRLRDLPKEVKYWKEMVIGSRDDVTIDDMHDYLKLKQSEYKDEIHFIRKMWYYRMYGYWCFINGKPTFIDGTHFFYCTHWHIDIGLPHYRDRDRRIFIGLRYFETTTEAPYKLKCTFLYNDEVRYAYFNNMSEYDRFHVSTRQEAEKKGVHTGSFELEEGYFVVDLNHRTTMGVNYPKHRREGATYKADCKGFDKLGISLSKKAGIISMTGKHAEKAFKFHLMAPFRKMAWYFKPNYEGSDDSRTELSLKPTARRIGSKGSFLSISDGLESYFDFATTASGSFYDSQKLIYVHVDEIGKTKDEDVYARHDVLKHCCQQGDGSMIIGFMFNTSTVGEMSARGGEKFFKLCQASLHNERNELGLTQTRLVTLFIPAYDGLDGFIGEYGESIVGDPTPAQAKYIGRDYGAKRHLEISEQQIRARKDPDMMADLNEQLRLNPTQYRDCFRRNTSDIGFNIAILTDRTNDLRFMPDATETGDFEYSPNDRRVFWQRKRDGDFRLSLNLDPKDTNLFHRNNSGLWIPSKPGRFIASSDAFKFMRTEGSKMSMGGGAVFWNRDYNIDPEGKPISEWSSHRFVCDYLGRPRTKPEYLNKMLYMCMYFGCLMSPELNVPDVWDHFDAQGFGEFLYYFRDLSTGQERKTPGFNSLTGIKNDIFNAWRDYIENHGMRERHMRILDQVKDINGLEEMTKFDLFTAGGGCLISSENQNPPRLKLLDLKQDDSSKLDEESYDISSFYSYDISV